jgi:PAS domain S-box-containing protein
MPPRPRTKRPVAAPTSKPMVPGVDIDLLTWAFSQGPLALAIHDAQLRYLWISDEMRRLFGLPDEDLRMRRLTEVLPDAFYTQVEERMRHVVKTGEPSHRHVRRIVPGELSPRAWSVSLTPLKDAEGNVHALCAAVVDVSDQYWARKWLAMLSEQGTHVGTTLDVTKTAEELTEMVVPDFADLAIVDLLDSVFQGEEPPLSLLPGPVALRRLAHLSCSIGTPEAGVMLGETEAYPEYSPPARCLATGQPVLSGVDDPAFLQWISHNPRRSAGLQQYGLRSMIAAPLRARDTVLGVLVCLRSRSEPYTDRHLHVAEEVAARAALSLDNARRYTRERSTAVALQRSMLPRRLPEQSAMDVATRYLPYLSADNRTSVGGDWYDVIPLSGARVALVVGDVVGHGVHASATMARLRAAVRTLSDVGLPPDELLTYLDDSVAQLSAESDSEVNGEGEVGATCLYAVYDPVSGRCSIARAGHPPPAVVLPDGTVEILDLPPGPPLGLGGLPFECAEFELPESSVIALFTDGLIGSREGDLQASMATLCRALAPPVPSLETMCDTVLKEMLPAPPTDDVALLIARTHVLDTDRVGAWDVPADPAVVAHTRAQALRRLQEWGLDELEFATELVVSELVTNAIRYGRPPIQLRLIRDRTLICEVSDASGTAPHLRRAHTYDEGGRGLLLVAQLAQRWGTRHSSSGKTIWCEQPIRLPES